ncbi:MAG: M23 family metallopeptidase [Patescibacteria group bacterium]
MNPTSLKLKLRGARKVLWLLIPFILLGAYLYKPEVNQQPTTNPSTSSGQDNQQLEKTAEISLSIRPENPIQGEPVLVSVKNLSGTSMIRSVVFNDKPLGVFDNSALIGIDLRQTTGSYPIILTLSDGRTIKRNLTVGTRTIVKAPLGIPQKLGGNTPEAEGKLLNSLVKEGIIINSVKSGPAKLWSGKFRYPLNGEIIITDVYGYSRITGGSTIAHKGTDFRAATGTPVYAMNSGKVAFTDYLRNYGNTIIIDHGLGLMTIYMHLSEIDVKVGDMVEKGKLIGKSGDTGYVLGPHLHITVRINGISIDPMKFMALLGE